VDFLDDLRGERVRQLGPVFQRLVQTPQLVVGKKVAALLIILLLKIVDGRVHLRFEVVGHVEVVRVVRLFFAVCIIALLILGGIGLIILAVICGV